MIKRNVGIALILIISACLGLANTPAVCAVRYVRPDGSDASAGNSWDAAKKTIQAAVSAAASNDEVWVATGTYAAYSSSSASQNIILNKTLSLYGGFAGDETQRAQRDPSAHPTIIDGNLEKPSPGIYIAGTAAKGVVVDGFVIRNCISGYVGTSASWAFGAVYCWGASNTIANNVLINNDYGVYSMDSGVQILNNRIVGSCKGGIVCTGSPLIAGNIIRGNGSPANGAGIRVEGTTSAPRITNNTIIGNGSCLDGSVVYTEGPMALSNNIIAFNSSGVFVASGTMTAKSNCVYGNTAYNYSGVTDPTGTNGNISLDPKLASRTFGDAHIQPDSPCRDTGDDTALSWIPADYLYDMDHQARTVGGHVDIGADESNGESWSDLVPAIIRVSPTGDDSYSGLSWLSAKRTVQAAIDAASVTGGEMWVAEGTYNECVTLAPYVYVYGGFSGQEYMRSDRDWAAHRTILDAKRAGTVVSAYIGHDVSGIDGFTIRGGASNPDAGYSQGSGIVCIGSSPTIANSIIMSNSGIDGGGIYCAGSAARILNNVIQGNWAERGGGVYCGTPYTIPSTLAPTLINNTISENMAVDGGGLYAELSSPTLTNNIIASNSSGVFAVDSQPVMKCNCVSGNKDYNYSGMTDPTGTDGNKSDDPLLASPECGNVHIQPNSPCRNAGDYSVVQPDWADMDHQSRILDGRVDIGADENNGMDSGGVPVIYVSGSGNDAHGGSNWLDAKATIKAGIDQAANTGGQVWVAGGIYTEQIELPGFVNVYGGFVGGEVSLGDRNPSANPTTIDGNAGGSVVSSYAGPGIIDGFTLRNGTGTLVYGTRQGGGVYSPGPMLDLVSCTITSNTAELGGGFYGQCPVTGITFIANSATANGGGLYCYGPFAEVTNCTVSGNNAVCGGGIAGESRVNGGSVASNTATQDGGGIRGADWVSGCTVSANTAGRDGGGLAGCTEITNSSISGNHAANNGGGVEVSVVNSFVTDSVISGNTADSSNNLTDKLRGGGGVHARANSTISRNTITSNTALTNGGGVCYLYAGIDSLPNDITHNTIDRNTAATGGGVYSDSPLPMFQGIGRVYVYTNRILGNRAVNGGGIKTVWNACVIGNLITGNIANANGGGGYVGGTTIYSNTIVNNTAASGGGLCNIAGQFCTMMDNILAFNSTGLNSQGAFALTNDWLYNPGDPQERYSHVPDPLFVNRLAGDYRLSAASPCINIGTIYTPTSIEDPNNAKYIPDRDIDGQLRVQGGKIDIGADEWWPGPGDAKKIADAEKAELSAITVTAAFPGFFYVESDDRTSGIRVNKTGLGPSVGTRIDVSGPPATADNGERCIAATTITLIGSGSIAPLALTNKALGGGDFGLQGGVWGWNSITDELGKACRLWGKIGGLNNIGLLVTAWGKYGPVSSSTFTIDDGSDVTIKCIVPDSVILGQDWTYVRVTGISSCEKVRVGDHDELHSMIRVRSQGDIVPVR